jgi:hypothetical protein
MKLTNVPLERNLPRNFRIKLVERQNSQESGRPVKLPKSFAVRLGRPRNVLVRSRRAY